MYLCADCQCPLETVLRRNLRVLLDSRQRRVAMVRIVWDRCMGVHMQWIALHRVSVRLNRWQVLNGSEYNVTFSSQALSEEVGCPEEGRWSLEGHCAQCWALRFPRGVRGSPECVGGGLLGGEEVPSHITYGVTESTGIVWEWTELGGPFTAFKYHHNCHVEEGLGLFRSQK